MPRVGPILSGFERFQVIAISGSLACLLHCAQVTQRTDSNHEALDVDILGLSVKNCVCRDLRESPKDIDLTQFGDHQVVKFSTEGSAISRAARCR